MSNLKSLVQRVKEICADPRYDELRDLWQRHNSMELVERVPFCMDIRHTMLADFMGYDVQSLTPDKIEDIIRFQLDCKIFSHEHIHDDRVPGPHIGIGAYHVPTEGTTMFGARRTSIPASEGWHVEPVIKETSDLDDLKYPEPHYDPEAHEKRAAMFRDILDDELPIPPPGIGNFGRGPMDTAVELRGWEQLMYDFIERPDFVHDMMRKITDIRKHYEDKRAELMGIELSSTWGGLWEDDVNCQVLSPALYEEFIWPYECEMASVYKSVTYHSCGKLTPVLHLIDQIPNLTMLYYSEPWTDLAEAHRITQNKRIIRIDMNPPTCIGNVAESDLRAHLQTFAETGKDCIWESHMASARTGTYDDVMQYVKVGKEVFSKARSS